MNVYLDMVDLGRYSDRVHLILSLIHVLLSRTSALAKMFRTLARASSRSLHTLSRPASSARSNARLRAVLGVSAVATSYLVWNSWYGQRIALDSSRSPPKAPSTPEPTPSPEFVPDEPPSPPKDEPSIPPASRPPSDAQPEGEAKGDQPAEGAEGEGEGSAQGGAFNPETGEINWDCPCLGGMAHGPCGLQFREAFSCFVFSEADPKGIDCVEKFKAMQECFREHPDVYGDDIMNDDDEEEEGLALDSASPRVPDAVEPANSPAAAPSERSEAAPPPAEQKSKPRKPAPSTSH
ncbi:transporter [Ganoderma sinense ZZ0214-1]|uniref:Mitochondrial intermembrane space import and assembly protein 40 n=1 Tax=Ganoderma sinense ZZ0214-1 TaxID=1077348 RepID=A0A2G8SN38_9APHY|nr:transporter [Ganoderma sinense ZZ0214-1]